MTDTAPPTSVRGDLTRLYYGLSRPVSGMQTAQLLADFRQLAKESFFGADKNGRAWDVVASDGLLKVIGSANYITLDGAGREDGIGGSAV